MSFYYGVEIVMASAGYESLTGKLVKLLARLKSRDVSPDYTYYGIASPWLQVSISLPSRDQHLHISINFDSGNVITDAHVGFPYKFPQWQ